MPSSYTLFSSFFLAVITSVSATEYAVGGEVVGWRVPIINETQLYNVWASRRRFYVGDSLRFRYGYDSLAIVEKYGFYHCDSSNAIAFFNEGDDVIVLYKAGPMYFISGNADACKQGLKMAVEVINTTPVGQNPPPTFNPPPAFEPPGSPDSPVVPSPELSPAPSPSDSMGSLVVSNFVTALIVGLGSWVF